MSIGSILTGIRRFFNKTLDVYIYIVLILVFIVTAYPFWYILVYSFSNPYEIFSNFLLLPKGFNLDSYKAVLSNPAVGRAFMVSVSRSMLGPLIATSTTMLVAYSLSRRSLPGNKVLTWFFVITMYFGAGLIPTYLLIKSIGMTGSFLVYILPDMMNVFGMILMRAYIESLPDVLHDSAYIDGANEFVIFYKIIAPLCMPVVAAIGLLSCVNHWNNYTDTLIYNSMQRHLYTLQYILVQFVSSISASLSSDINQIIAEADRARVTPMGVRMAITIVTVVPISMVYPFIQRYFIKGIMIGAVKG